MCSNRCRKRLPHRLRRKTLRTATGRRRWPKQRKTCSRERSGAAADWLSVSYPTISQQPGPVRSRNRRHYLGRDSGDQRSRRHPENPASGGTFHGILAHGGAGGMFARSIALSGTVVGAAGRRRRDAGGGYRTNLHGCAGNQGEDSRRIHPARRNRAARNGRNLRLLRFRHLQRPDRLQSGQGRGYDSGEITSVDEISDHCAQRDSASTRADSSRRRSAPKSAAAKCCAAKDT